jgi:hypothetical protein
VHRARVARERIVSRPWIPAVPYRMVINSSPPIDYADRPRGCFVVARSVRFCLPVESHLQIAKQLDESDGRELRRMVCRIWRETSRTVGVQS